jgi:hypothetical protein
LFEKSIKCDEDDGDVLRNVDVVVMVMVMCQRWLGMSNCGGEGDGDCLRRAVVVVL